MEFLAEYASFLAKTATVVIALLIVLSAIAGLRSKGRRKPGGHLQVTRLNQFYDGLRDRLEAGLFDKAELKALRKRKAKAEKKQKKQQYLKKQTKQKQKKRQKLKKQTKQKQKKQQHLKKQTK